MSDAQPYSANDLTVVIPTIDRWGILVRTLESLAAQTVSGFEVVVVVDGLDHTVPDAIRELPHVRLVEQAHAGPGVARNTGVDASDRPLILLLGDDMVADPDLIERHLAAHARSDAPKTAVLGHVSWHAEVGDNRLQRWMDWSGTQFDYHLIDPEADAGFGRFFSCNVSLPRALYLEAGGFDPAFVYYYEDLDFGWRLDQVGMRLRYEPAARTNHLHGYDWAAVQRRFDGIVVGEQMMAAKHDWFEPWFKARMEGARRSKPVGAWWPVVADLVPDRLVRVVPGGARGREALRARANTRLHQELAPRFLWLWDGHRGLAELKAYLGDDFDEGLLHTHQAQVEREEEDAPDEATFYRTSTAYLYDLTAFGLWDTKLPYFEDLRALMPRPMRVLDYGCGIGTDGLRLIGQGHQVGFADFANPSTEYLRWRLESRGVGPPTAEVFDIDEHVPGGFDLAYSFDVIEHVEDPFAFLAGLEERAGVVAVNLLEPDEADVHLHKPLPISALLRHAGERGILRYRLYHGRSHLVIYRSGGAGPAGERPTGRVRLRSTLERRLGAHRRVARLLP